MTVSNPENQGNNQGDPSATVTQTPTPDATAAANDALRNAPDPENMTAVQFREWMDALPDRIADAIDVKFGTRREAEKNASGTTATATTEADPRKGGFLGTGKTFGEFWFGGSAA